MNYIQSKCLENLANPVNFINYTYKQFLLKLYFTKETMSTLAIVLFTESMTYIK